MHKEKTFAIIGCGLGGATLAALLQQAGYQVLVFEQSSAFLNIGAGIHVTPNAMKILRRIGAEAHVLKKGFRQSTFSSRCWDNGEQLFRLPLEDARMRYGGDYMTIHRADLHVGITSQVLPDSVHFNKRLQSLYQTDDHVDLFFDDGTRVRVDYVIGADGISSMVRKAMVGEEEAAHYTGQLVFRAIIPADQLKKIPKETLCKWWAPDRFVIAYYIDRAQTKFYFVAGFPDGDWKNGPVPMSGCKERLLREFEGFHPDVIDLLESADDLMLWPLHARKEVNHWYKNRVVLLGDACHPMLPHMTQGAAMAMEDALALLNCLEKNVSDSMEDIFVAYRDARTERVSRVQKESATNTWLKEEMEVDWVFGQRRDGK